MTAQGRFRVLYIEDSAADTEFLLAAFRRVAPLTTVEVIDSGSKAIPRLRVDLDRGTLPDMILLDLKMPGMDGHEVLASIKTDPHLRHIPVIILTSSRLEEDILRAYEVGANSYLPKPGDALGYTTIAAELHRFWVETALMPPERPR